MVAPAREIIASMKAKEEKDLAKAIEKDFASKLIDYKT